jgi:tripartite-type tricarboxylate transporter receptor subunit TctC
VALVATNPQILAVKPELGIKSFKAFIDLLKSKPGALSFGSSGVGGTSHLAMEQLLSMSETKMLHVPYKAGNDALQGLLSGQIQAAFVDAASAVPLINAGRLVALGTSGKTRVPGLPDVAPIREEGLPEFESATVFAIFVPKGTPASVVSTLNRTVNKVLQEPATRESLRNNAYDAGGGTPDDLARLVQDESARWGGLIKARGIKPE